MLWITNIYTHIIYAAYDYYLSNGKSFFSKPIEIQISKQQWAPKEDRESSTCYIHYVTISLAGAYCRPLQKGLWIDQTPWKASCWASGSCWPAELALGSQHEQMRRLTWEQSGGIPAGRLVTLQRAEVDKFIPACREMKKGHGSPSWTTKILRCQT